MHGFTKFKNLHHAPIFIFDFFHSPVATCTKYVSQSFPHLFNSRNENNNMTQELVILQANPYRDSTRSTHSACLGIHTHTHTILAEAVKLLAFSLREPLPGWLLFTCSVHLLVYGSVAVCLRAAAHSFSRCVLVDAGVQPKKSTHIQLGAQHRRIFFSSWEEPRIVPYPGRKGV